MDDRRLVLGLWPIAGITTVGVTEQDARRTVAEAIALGIRRFDTAYSYGYDGESDRLIGTFVQQTRDQFWLMGKVGQRWNARRERIVDGTPQQLTADAEESLRRIGTDYFDILLLHSPDPKVPLADSAAALAKLLERGLCKQIGISNATPETIAAFAEMVPLSAIQCPLNLVQRDTLASMIQPAGAAGRQVYVYWTLMKGLLAGKITRDHVFAEGDSRPGYAIFQGELRASIHDALDQLQIIGQQSGMSLAQLSIGWAMSQGGVTAALVGARRPDQVRELVAAKPLDPATLAAIDAVIANTVTADSKSP